MMTEFPLNPLTKITAAYAPFNHFKTANSATCVMQELHNFCTLESSHEVESPETSVQVDGLAKDFCDAVFLKVAEFTEQVKLQMQKKAMPNSSVINAISEGTITSTLDEFSYFSTMQSLQGCLKTGILSHVDKLAKGLCDDICLKTVQFNEQLKLQIQEEPIISSSFIKYRAAAKKAHLMVQIQGLMTAITNRVHEFHEIPLPSDCKHK